MSLPTSRNRTYATDSPIRSADLNDLQDCIVGVKHKELTLALPFFGGKVASGTPSYSGAGNVTGINSTVLAVPLPVGTRIKQITYTYNRGGSGNVQFDFSRRTGDGVGANFVNVSTSTISSGTGFTTAVHSAINHTILAGWSYWIIASSSDAANVLALADIAFDRL